MLKDKNSIEIENRPIRFFDNAEEAWMWFCFCETLPKSHNHDKSDVVRVCETSDIAIVVKRLVKQKILGQEHLKILSLYGLKQVPPYEKGGDPKKHCQLWKQALERILEPLKIKGIVDSAGTVFKFYGEVK